MAKFKPSRESLVRSDPNPSNLLYVQHAAKLLEQHLVDGGDLPAWVEAKIQEAAMNLGMAISYMQRQRGEK